MKVRNIALSVALVMSANGRTHSSGRSTVVLGDSITSAVLESLSEIAPGIVVNARPARTIKRSMISDNGYQWLPVLALTGRTNWIVALGTNDAWTESLRLALIRRDIQDFARKLDDSLPNGGCVTWILPFIGAPASVRLRKRSQAVSQYIRTEIEQHRCWTTVDWPKIAKDKPEFISSDGVHLTSQGKKEFSKLIASRLQSTSSQQPAN